MMRIHKEGRWIVAITIFLLLLILVLAALFLPSWINLPLQVAALILLVLILRFFRNPQRRPFLADRTLTSPADGKVVVIEKLEEHEYLKGPCIQVSVFMSIHNVHINYVPISGKAEYIRYHPGSYLLARHPKSSELNERWSTGLRTPYGKVLIRQVAGYVARRIRNYAVENQEMQQGRELGFIKFGSRVDVFLPAGSEVKVSVGDRVTGGVSPLARLK